MLPEATFAAWIRKNTDWFTQRIETTTASGVPDIWMHHNHSYAWIELKANTRTNVQIRSSQYAWIRAAQRRGIHVWVMNRSPDHEIQVWTRDFEVTPGKKNYLKITSFPDLWGEAKKVCNELNELLTKYADAPTRNRTNAT